MFFVIGLPSCFPLPCFVPGCHAFDFKIAAAALRPRNDTNLERFYLENERFLFYAVVFCAVSPRIVFQTFCSENRSVFPQNLFGATGTAGGFLATRKSLGDCFLQFLLLQRQGFFFFRGCILLQLHFVCVQTFISTTSASARILERQHNAGHNPGSGRAWKISWGKIP